MEHQGVLKCWMFLRPTRPTAISNTYSIKLETFMIVLIWKSSKWVDIDAAEQIQNVSPDRTRICNTSQIWMLMLIRCSTNQCLTPFAAAVTPFATASVGGGTGPNGLGPSGCNSSSVSSLYSPSLPSPSSSSPSPSSPSSSSYS